MKRDEQTGDSEKLKLPSGDFMYVEVVYKHPGIHHDVVSATLWLHADKA